MDTDPLETTRKELARLVELRDEELSAAIIACSRKPGFFEKWAGLFAFLAISVVVIVGFAQINAARDQSQMEAHDRVKAVNELAHKLVAVQVHNCQKDHKFRVQYKRRGEAEIALLNLFVGLSRANVNNGINIEQSQQFIDEFGPFIHGQKKLKIIPIPNCKRVRKNLTNLVPIPLK